MIKRKLNTFMLVLVIVAVALTSAVRTTTVYADDGGTDPVAEATAVPAEGEGTSAEEVPPAEEPVAATEAPAVEPVAEEPAAATEVPAVEPAAEEPAPVAEVLEQLPEDTELVVINEAGEAEPLATAEAAEIVTTGDPMWCPAGVTPGDASCTGSHTTFADLIAELADPANGYAGPGVVWVARDYNGADDNQIAFEGNSPDGYVGNLTNLSDSDLTIRGGWNPTDNSVDPNTPSQLDVSLVVAFWSGNVTLENIVIANTADNAGFGLLVTGSTGDVTLDNVTVTNIPVSTFAPIDSGEGAIIDTLGDVEVRDSNFGLNATDGLDVATAGGNITLTNVVAWQNGMSGTALIAGAGTVTVTDSVFTGNLLRGLSVDAVNAVTVDHVLASGNGTGLNILTEGDIDVSSTEAGSNNTGAILNTENGSGTINISDSQFGFDEAGNNWTGLHAESGGAISLIRVVASENVNNGAYLEAEGDITVEDSIFNSNVQFCSCVDPGLYAASNGGNVTLNSVIADGNICGTGAVLKTNGTGAITVNGDEFNGNGTYGIDAQTENGDITLNGVDASFNLVKGAYLNSYGTGNIFINIGTFVENGAYGIYASASEGNIDLEGVTVTGDNGLNDGLPEADDLTDYGAVLTAGSGSVFVTDSTFELNTAVGLKIVSGGDVYLTNVIADHNGSNGVEVYSTSTGDPICPEDPVVNIVVTVSDGEYTYNGGYGLVVKPGPNGDLVFLPPATLFGNNGLGDYLLDKSQSFKDCTPDPKPPCEEEDPCDEEKPNIVEVPETGGEPVEQDCDKYTSTILKLPNGTWVKVSCPYTGFSNLKQIEKQNLPGPLGLSVNFASAIAVSLTDANGKVILNKDGTVTINFVLPKDADARGYSILFWDETLNDGKGGWVELPLYEAGTSFPLHPDDPDDPRMIISGVKQVGDTVTVTVNFSGVFVLVER